MPIYRGAGGSGDATADSSSEALLIRELVADADADALSASASAAAAAASVSAAQIAETNAELAETNAETAQTAAELAETNAETAATNAAASAVLAASYTPSQTGNAGKYLQTNGTITSWQNADALPSQSGNAGRCLTTDGTAALWSPFGTIASQAANNVNITGGAIDGTAVGATTASTGRFSTLTTTNTVTLPAGDVTSPSLARSGNTNTGMYFPASDTIAFSTGGTARLRINNFGRIGINTSNTVFDNSILNVAGDFATTGAITTTRVDESYLRTNVSNAGAGLKNWRFGGFSDGSFRFATEADNLSAVSYRLSLTSTGNLGVGTASPAHRLHVRGGVNTTTRIEEADGSLIDLKCFNSLHEIESSGTSDLTINKSGNANLILSTNNTERIRVISSGGIRFSSNIGVGNTTPTTSGTGITFPASQNASTNANTLDDYEEGTFTPTVFGATTAGTTTYTAQNGFYTKIGRQVTVVIRVQYSALTGTGLYVIGSLPFTSTTSANCESVGTVMVQSLNWNGGTYLNSYMVQNSTELNIYGNSDDGALSAQTCVNEAVDLWITHTYFST
jgi:hypothetical protein